MLLYNGVGQSRAVWIANLTGVTATTYKAVSSLGSTATVVKAVVQRELALLLYNGVGQSRVVWIATPHRCNSNHIQGCFQLGFHSSSGVSSFAEHTRHCCCAAGTTLALCLTVVLPVCSKVDANKILSGDAKLPRRHAILTSFNRVNGVCRRSLQ